MDVDVVHNAEERRFQIEAGTELAVLEYQRVRDRIIFTHTGVPQALQGRGIGAALARSGLEHARAEGLTVKPLCPFVAAYIAKHPEYRALVQ